MMYIHLLFHGQPVYSLYLEHVTVFHKSSLRPNLHEMLKSVVYLLEEFYKI